MTPSELFEKALELQIKILAITDHDSTEGFSSLQALAASHPEIRLVPGLEVSAEGEMHCHLLGYFVDLKSPGFQERLARLRSGRVERIREMTNKINALGLSIDIARVMALAAGGAVGRPHLADALIEKGYVRTRKEAFDRYLKSDGPAYVATQGPTARECIEFIRSAKGVPVLAHPSYYTSPDLLKRLVDDGLMGMEVYYPEHSRALTARYLDLAKTYNLAATGGSDFHGPKTQRPSLACVNVPESALTDLERALERV